VSGVTRRGAWLSFAAALAVLTGCSYSAEPSKDNLAASQAISKRLEALPGVIRVDGGYARDVENPGSASFSIGVRRGTDLAKIADAAVEAVWRSRIDPIGSMSVFVAEHDDPDVHLRRFADYKLDKAKLERRYGPRP
jgi:hypothetical protein